MKSSIKQLLLSVLFSGCISMSFAQNYSPLLVEANEWNVLSAGLLPPFPFDTVFQTVTYKLSGDTVLNSVTYKKLYESWEESPTTWALWSFLREDEDHVVWERYKDSDNEWVLYNFGLQAGDTVQVGEFPETLQIDSITSVSINGTDRMKFWMTYLWAPDNHETWIEGVGSDQGIVWSGSIIVGGFYRFLCLSNDGAMIYMNPDYTSCYIVTGLKGIPGEEILFYPNPADNTIKIINSGLTKIISISLYNMAGLETKSFPARTAGLDISGIPPAIYILKISTSKGDILKKVAIR